jgi:pimeloyl-ACP methyl ester carboxylesterase
MYKLQVWIYSYFTIQQEAAAGHQVIVWDQRGYRNSTLVTGEVGVAAAGRDLSVVLEANGLDSIPVHLVGQALDALVVAAWTVANPQHLLREGLAVAAAGHREQVPDEVRRQGGRSAAGAYRLSSSV